MTEADVDSVRKIELESFTAPWSRESFQLELNNKFATYFVCDFEGEIMGYGGIWIVFEEAHITNVAVSSIYRKKGAGKALLTQLVEIARKKKATHILLEVRPSNEPAFNMYKNFDFIPTGIRHNYYSDNNEDAIIMTKYLT